MAPDTTTTAETTRISHSWVIDDPDYKYCTGYGALTGMMQALGEDVGYLNSRGETTVDIEYLKGFLERANDLIEAVNNCKRSS